MDSESSDKLPWSQAASELLAYKVRALKLFANIEYEHWLDVMVAVTVRDGQMTREEATKNYKLPKGLTAPAETAGVPLDTFVSTRGAWMKRLHDWYSNPSHNWHRIEPFYPALRDIVQASNEPVPDTIIHHLDQFVPHPVFHALYTFMNMRPDQVADIRRDLEAEYNIYRFSCYPPTGLIAIGTCKIAYDERHKAICTHETYLVQNQTYELSGYLVQADHTYRVFSKHDNANTAQVMLLDSLTRFFRRDGADLAGKARCIKGFLVDRHENKFFYLTPVCLYRIHDKHHKKQEPRDATKQDVDKIDPAIYLHLHRVPEKLSINIFTF